MNIADIKAHDAATYALLVELAKAKQGADYAMSRVHEAAYDRKVRVNLGVGRSEYRYQLTDVEAQDKVADLAADPATHYPHKSSDNDASFLAYIAKEAQGTLDNLRKVNEEITRLGSEIADREDVFHANRWARFEAVPGGHIHNRNSTCHTLRPTTRVAWIVELSGDTEADAVALYGPALCSHCFKSAPVEWIQQAKVQKTTDSRGEVQILTLAEAQAIADEKAAKKAAKEAKKAARGN